MLNAFASFVIDRRRWIVGVLVVLTAVLGLSASRIVVKTEFADLLPQEHPYVQVDAKWRKSFGSSNLVTVMLQVKQGDVFQPEILAKIKRITRELETVRDVNPGQITSLATRNLKDVHASTESIDTRPLMWPDLPKDAAGIEQLKLSVINNPLVFGRYVSRDLKSALITFDFFGHNLDFNQAFTETNKILDAERDDSVTIWVSGEPILNGWVAHYLPQTLWIFMITLALVAVVLFVSSRSLRGTCLPMLAGFASAVWALGVAHMLGYSFDPLVLVVVFLISARSVSHSVQVVSQFETEVMDNGRNAIDAAKASVSTLFKPGTLGVVTDAGSMAVVALTSIPLLQKVAIIGCIWVLTISLTSVFLTPALLSWVKHPDRYLLKWDVNPALDRLLARMGRLALGPYARWILGFVAVLFVSSGIYAFNLKIGDATTGSPILWPGSYYNQSADQINRNFGGVDRMFLVIAGKEPDIIKQPATLHGIQSLQRFLEAQPEIGGTVSIADIVPTLGKLVREGNPRYQEVGDDPRTNAELIYLYTSGADPADIEQYTDTSFKNASILVFFKDRQGQTIRTAIGRIKEHLAHNPIPGVEVQLAGGIIGVVAAVNEELLAGQIESIALALLVVVLCCTVAYRTTAAGMLFMVPVLLSNTITFSFMALYGIGMNINTIPVAALGIGLGVDYAYYVIDRIKEEWEHTGDLEHSVLNSLLTSGRAVFVTGLTLCISVLVWSLSSLKFQAQMGLLMGLWLFISASAALLVMPALVVVFKPQFVLGKRSGQQAKAKPQAAGALWREATGAHGAE